MNFKQKVDENHPWFKPPPLETIDITASELKDSCFLRLCSLLNLFTGISGILSSLVHGYILFAGNWTYDSIPLSIIRAYFVLFGILIVLQEREYASFFRYFAVLESWIGRGLYLILCSAIMIALEIPEGLVFLRSLNKVVSIALGSSGLLYFSLGTLCFREIKLREMMQVKSSIFRRFFSYLELLFV
jgi:hypothetical protein